jgi:hypothetical protein
LTDSEKEEGLLLARRALAAAVGLRRYLTSEQAQANAKSIEVKSKRRLDKAKIPELDEP